MILTEKEAAERWCPFSRVLCELRDPEDRLNNAPSSFNRIAAKTGEDQRFPIGARCIGSRCMAWQWGPPISSGGLDDGPAKDQSKRRGACGLAGKP